MGGAEKKHELRLGVIENIDFRGKMRDKEQALGGVREEVWNLDTLIRCGQEGYQGDVRNTFAIKSGLKL